MNWLIEDIEQNGPATTEAEAQRRPIPDFEGQAAGLPLPATRFVAALDLLGLFPEHRHYPSSS